MDSHHCPKTEALDAVVIVQEKKKAPEPSKLTLTFG